MIYMAIRRIPPDDQYPDSIEMIDETSVATTQQQCMEKAKQMDDWCPSWSKEYPVIRIGMFRAVEVCKEVKDDS